MVVMKTSLTIPDDVYWRFKEEAPRRRMTDKDAVAEALSLWITVPDASALLGLLKDPDSNMHESVLTAIDRWKKALSEKSKTHEPGKKTASPRAVNER